MKKLGLSSESLNEVFVSSIHERQGFEEYTPYYLVSIAGKPYDLGCYSEAFTNEKLELVPAYAVVTEEKQPNHISDYEFFIYQCVKHGLDEEYVRRFMEYETMVDFITSGRDRHWNNFAVLRDSDTLKFVRMAPIFDSGKCLFVESTVPQSDSGVLNVETTSFAKTMLKMLNTVRNRNIVDLNKLPSRDDLFSLYLKDSKIEEWQIDQICSGYERSISLCDEFQQGRDLSVKAKQKRFFRADPAINIPGEKIDLDPEDLKHHAEPRRDPAEEYIQESGQDQGEIRRQRKPDGYEL